MSHLYMMTTITERKLLPDFVSLYRENGIGTGLIVLGRGTAPPARAAVFLDSAEKGICFNIVTRENWEKAKRLMKKNLRIEVPGTGVAFTIPLSSIGGRRELAFLTDGQDFKREEESAMRGTNRELLVVFNEPGYNEMMMDAAREAGAYGGTVIHARGTGMQKAEKFLGISLASEKEMTFIVIRTEQRDRIMQAIMMKAGVATPAKSIVFSLPVTDTAGLKLADEEEAEENHEG